MTETSTASTFMNSRIQMIVIIVSHQIYTDYYTLYSESHLY